MKTPIVIPLCPKGGYWKDNTELRYALRSIAEHFTDPYQIYIIGESLPKWIDDVKFIRCEGDLKAVIRTAAEVFPDGFFWWYDDICLLQNQSIDELRITTANEVWQKPRIQWAKDLEKVKLRLQKENRQCIDFSRPHGPYWFDKGMIEESFKDWPRMEGRFPFETWILNKRISSHRSGITRQYYGRFLSPPGPEHVILSYNDLGFTRELQAWLRARWPVCRHEK